MISLQVFPRIRAVRTRGPYRKKLDRWNARQQPIKFKDSGFWTGKMLKKKMTVFIFVHKAEAPRKNFKQNK